MSPEKKNRKNISLDSQTISLLEVQAEKEGKELECYMEQVLMEKAHEIELTDEYKAKMDKVLEKHRRGEIDYVEREEFFNRISEK